MCFCGWEGIDSGPAGIAVPHSVWKRQPAWGDTGVAKGTVGKSVPQDMEHLSGQLACPVM